MLIYNTCIKTQVKFDLGYNPLNFDGVMGLLLKKIAQKLVQKTAFIRFIFGMLMYNIETQVKFDLAYNPLIFDGVMGLL